MLTLLNEYIIIKGYFELLNKVKRVCKYEITCFYNLYGYVVAYILCCHFYYFFYIFKVFFLKVGKINLNKY